MQNNVKKLAISEETNRGDRGFYSFQVKYDRNLDFASTRECVKIILSELFDSYENANDDLRLQYQKRKEAAFGLILAASEVSFAQSKCHQEWDDEYQSLCREENRHGVFLITRNGVRIEICSLVKEEGYISWL